ARPATSRTSSTPSSPPSTRTEPGSATTDELGAASEPVHQPRDILHMRQALALARRGLGRVAPNPAVGCVIVRDGRVVARGWTAPGGRPHAETEAIAAAPPGGLAGATAYVSLEP